MAHIVDFQRVLSHSFASCRQPAAGCPSSRRGGRRLPRRPRGLEVKASSLESNGPTFLSALYGQLRPTKLHALAQDLEARVMTNSIGLENVDYKGLYVDTPQVVDLPFLWQRLEPLVQYLPPREQQEVRKGLEVAFQAHHGQRRKSGEPFITHPVEVTRILAELRMDYESLIAGLLHDTVEDTDTVTFSSIEQLFGPNVRKIVEGETKLSKITKLSTGQDIAAAAASTFDLDEKARDLQQLFLAMTEEVRIILVKLADRLHNMRTLDSMAPHKQKKIAQETLTVFAPLAKLLGLNCIKDELEELSFRYSDPDKYGKIVRSFDKLTCQHRSLVLRAREELQARLNEDTVLADSTHGVVIRLRQKSVYAVHKKLAASQKSLKDLQSVVVFQIIVQEKKDGDAARYSVAQQLCYHVLGLVHSLWSPVPGSLKDYIATPKTNGYQSLHTTVLPLTTVQNREDCNLIPVDIQIRTARMDLLAEFGVAAKNWLQKEGRMNGAKVPLNPYSVSLKNLLPFPFSTGPSNGNGNGRKPDSHEVLNSSLLRPQRLGQWIDSPSNIAAAPDSPDWMAEIRKWQEDFVGSVTAREFVDGVTNDVLGQSVFVFTPKGGMRRLPKGATVVDFAYHLHTEVGNLMRSAKVNGKYVPFNHELINGEVVEIVKGDATDAAAVRLREQWLKFVKTRTAKFKIKQLLKDRTPHHACASADEPAPMEIPQEMGLWLTVQCDNKPGVLAGVCSIISKHGCNIKTYSGRPDASCEGSIMHFNLEPIDLATLEVVCDEIEHLPTVLKIEFGSNWPMP